MPKKLKLQSNSLTSVGSLLQARGCSDRKALSPRTAENPGPERKVMHDESSNAITDALSPPVRL